MRARIGSKNEVGRRQAVGEMVYEIANMQAAEQGLRTRRSAAGSSTSRR